MTILKKRLRLDAEGPVVHPNYYRQDIRDALARIEALETALREARRAIIGLAESGTERIIASGGDCDPPERTYRPYTDKIDALLLEGMADALLTGGDKS